MQSFDLTMIRKHGDYVFCWIRFVGNSSRVIFYRFILWLSKPMEETIECTDRLMLLFNVLNVMVLQTHTIKSFSPYLVWDESKPALPIPLKVFERLG